MDGGTGMGTSCQRWTIFSAGGRCFAALSKIWCQQAWYILVELLLEPHYRENLEWNFTFTFLFSRMLICLPGMTVSAKRRLPMYTVPLSAPFETLAINTWSAKWVCPKLGTDILYIYKYIIKWRLLRSGKTTMKPGRPIYTGASCCTTTTFRSRGHQRWDASSLWESDWQRVSQKRWC